MKFNNTTYDILKYVALIGLPAIATFVGVIGAVWDISHTDQVVKSIIAFNVLFSSLIVVRGVQYSHSDAKFDGEIQYELTASGDDDEIVHIDLGPTVKDAIRKGEVTMKMVPRRAA